MPSLGQWKGTAPVAADGSSPDWSAYGGDLSGRRYSPLTQIHGGNVGELQAVWQYRTGDGPAQKREPSNLPAFEATPLKIDDSLYFCTPTNVVISLDAETGRERWRFNPETDTRGHYLVTCRGVSYHRQEVQAGHCTRRILAGTIDGRLLALDADDGKPCADFGRNGQVSLRGGQEPIKPGFFSITSPPNVVGGVAIVGGLVLDNQSVDVPSGVVRAYDVITGQLRWAWDSAREQNPVPAGQPYGRGSPNAWGVFSADPALGLVFVPTGNRSPDYFGGHRTPAEDSHASAVVAIEVATGKTRWVFQTVHHDIWDYDVASQPVLVDMNVAGSPVPALVQATKQGQVFVLDRRDGKPIYRVEERPVPRGTVPGDRASATQPFSVEMPALHPLRLSEDDMWGLTPFDRAWCRTEFKKHRHEGLFTPPSLQGTVNYPSNLGASNWGSVAIDPRRGILIANTNRIASVVTMIPREEMNRRIAAGEFAHSPSEGTPYMADARPFLSPLGIPCTRPPWGVLTAIDLDKRTVLWERPLGTTRDLAPLPIPLNWGVPNAGGSLITGGGLVFIGAAADDYLRAFSVESGDEIWRARLPAGGQATPMTYLDRNGRQYVVIAAGGHAHLGSTLGDYIVAFAIAPKHKRNAAK
ncbi:pyrroloquinoline quinone-dependent dehydrogenase [Denitratisoma oestradiolicum]|nr:pyrroloquinoline quinone-dependent dehydrogenase [Denitratisoma oestradiolicum]